MNIERKTAWRDGLPAVRRLLFRVLGPAGTGPSRFGLLAGLMIFGTLIPAGIARTQADIEFARVGDMPLLLDLYLPDADVAPAPGTIVWVHGGAWRRGSRESVPIRNLTERGWAIASVEYRLSPVAKFPAQIHDIKAAIRFLRARGEGFGVATGKIVVAGASAGGHLAALVGVSNGDAFLEGTVGEHRDESSDVQAAISFYGASNLTTILAQSTPHGSSVRVPALDLLLGGQPDVEVELATKASPVFYVDAGDPPLLLFHGDQDPQMPINQSHELEGRYRVAGAPVQFIVVHGAAHGGKAFYTTEQLAKVDAWLRSVLVPGWK